jgi:hypothetical protein
LKRAGSIEDSSVKEVWKSPSLKSGEHSKDILEGNLGLFEVEFLG